MSSPVKINPNQKSVFKCALLCAAICSGISVFEAMNPAEQSEMLDSYFETAKDLFVLCVGTLVGLAKGGGV